MKLAKALAVIAALFLLGAASKPAEARTYFSFGYYAPGISIYAGHYPYYYGPYYSYYFPRRYYRYRHRYRPRYRYRRAYRYRVYGGRCSYWGQRCAANWGYGGPNYRGCLRYYGCY